MTYISLSFSSDRVASLICQTAISIAAPSHFRKTCTYSLILGFAHVEWGITGRGCCLDLNEVFRSSSSPPVSVQIVVSYQQLGQDPLSIRVRDVRCLSSCPWSHVGVVWMCSNIVAHVALPVGSRELGKCGIQMGQQLKDLASRVRFEFRRYAVGRDDIRITLLQRQLCSPSRTDPNHEYSMTLPKLCSVGLHFGQELCSFLHGQ